MDAPGRCERSGALCQLRIISWSAARRAKHNTTRGRCERPRHSERGRSPALKGRRSPDKASTLMMCGADAARASVGRFASRGRPIEWCRSQKLRIRVMPLKKRAKLKRGHNKLKRKGKMLKQVMRGPTKSNSTYYTTAGVRQIVSGELPRCSVRGRRDTCRNRLSLATTAIAQQDHSQRSGIDQTAWN
jgi:hypothetical protein